ncbi:hypothetical protein PUN28_017233 [Cardiocondyla obscurior]|uniref:Uncharacterized protein n=1 Tax=Cardiocondyla obscurior TaxID=286306 RepID=A0AAW2ERA7_9HYME
MKRSLKSDVFCTGGPSPMLQPTGSIWQLPLVNVGVHRGSEIALDDDEDDQNVDDDERVPGGESSVNALASLVVLTKPWNGWRAIRTTTGRALRVGRWSAPKPRRGGRRRRSW